MSRDLSTQRFVGSTEMERLASWSMRKPVIALMGEFSAGKSTLMNLLLRQKILPTQVTATRMPPVWIKYGTEPAYRVDLAGKRHPVEIMTPGSIPLEDTRFVRLHCTADLLRNCDLMDTPGISDPNIKPDDLLRTVRYASSVMWCSHAGQAWRESERGAWEGLPERLRQTSILLVTRKDKIETEIDLRKIDRRLERETSHLFNARIFVSLTDALQAREAGQEEEWAASGAKLFLEMLEKIIEGIYLQRSFQLARYSVGEALAEVAQVRSEVSAESLVLPESSAAERRDMPSLETVEAGADAESARAEDEPVDETEVAAPVLRSSGSNIGIAQYRLKTPEPEAVTAGRRVDLANYRLKDPLLHAVEREEQAAVPTVEITHTSAIAIDPQAEELSKELSRTALIWDAITCQFDVSRTPRLVTAVDAVLADLKRDEASAFAPLAART